MISSSFLILQSNLTNQTTKTVVFCFNCLLQRKKRKAFTWVLKMNCSAFKHAKEKKMHFSYLLLLFFIFLNIQFSPSLSQSNSAPSQYSNCAPLPYRCGNTTFTISYPFHIDARPSYCGNPEYYINCTNMNTTLAITISDQQYQITSIDYNNNLMNIVNKDFISDTGCPQAFSNTTINTNLYQYSQRDRNLTVYINCSGPSLVIPTIVNYVCLDFTGRSYYRLDNGTFNDLFGRCSSIINVPLGQETANDLVNGRLQFRQALQQGFSLEWTAGSDWCSSCVNSGGYCGYNGTDNLKHPCFCPNGTSIDSCDSGGAGNNTANRIIIMIIDGLALFSVLGFIFIPGFPGRKRIIEAFHKKKNAKHSHTIETFLENYGSLATKRYAYYDIKRMTKSFSDKIGQGGYGSVYKGKLFNGHLVAVKILSETKGNGEDFINEVAAIGKTSHVNIVSLLGFCVEGSKRALIYDFMSNGSLDKYIYLDKGANERSLGWEKLNEITIGIARGLEYLHRGCNTRIVHFDIKPHNILLDQDFCPKISDFGMAKLCQPKQSIISIYGARGTIGYIAPEVLSRAFGVVSSKSDVYSYGMMLLELFGSKRKNLAGLESASENYFPQSIYQHIENNAHFDANEYGLTEEYEEIAKKIMIVGFWCIQTMPENRPTISRVVEMLEGSMNLLVNSTKTNSIISFRFDNELAHSIILFIPFNLMAFFCRVY